MKKYVLSFFICLLLSFSLIIDTKALPLPTNKAGAESVLGQMETVGRNLNSLVATIWQQKKNTQLGIDDPVETGELYYLPAKNGAMKLRIDINAPTKKTVIITGDEIKFYQPTVQQMLITSLKNAKGSQSFGSLAITFGSVSAIKTNYDVAFVKEEKIQGEQTSLLHLTPKQATPYKSIDIWISHSSWLPVQENLVENNGDVTTIRLSNLKKNESFNVKALIENFAPPKSTKIVKG
ncbi:MAG: outer membrane lipoprotein carrier protein LolA [Acidobacteria bacterium]|nr:outer membrane lipoprotein carrier protein LolA [Acidobacteriota bacterium]